MTIHTYIPRPQGFTFMAWAAQVADILADQGVMNPISEEDWKTWGSSLLYSPELAFVPDPYGFPSWQDWASRVAETF